MTVYTSFIATANRLISKYGQTVNWVKNELTLNDPAKPWLGSSAVPTVYSPKIAFVPADGNMYGMQKYKTQIDAGEVTLFGLMAPQEFTPELSDEVRRSGDPLVIKWIDEVKPAGEVVLIILGIV